MATTLVQKNGNIAIEGNIRFYNVMSIRKLAEAAIDATQGESCFDLAKADDSDSSALAMLLGLTRYAKQSNKSVRIVNIPGALKNVSLLCGITSLLPLDDSADG